MLYTVNDLLYEYEAKHPIMDIEIQQVVVNLLPTMSYTIFPPLDKDPNLQRQSGEPTSHEMLNNDIRRTVETVRKNAWSAQ